MFTLKYPLIQCIDLSKAYKNDILAKHVPVSKQIASIFALKKHFNAKGLLRVLVEISEAQFFLKIEFSKRRNCVLKSGRFGVLEGILLIRLKELKFIYLFIFLP